MTSHHAKSATLSEPQLDHLHPSSTSQSSRTCRRKLLSSCALSCLRENGTVAMSFGLFVACCSSMCSCITCMTLCSKSHESCRAKNWSHDFNDAPRDNKCHPVEHKGLLSVGQQLVAFPPVAHNSCSMQQKCLYQYQSLWVWIQWVLWSVLHGFTNLPKNGSYPTNSKLFSEILAVEVQMDHLSCVRSQKSSVLYRL